MVHALLDYTDFPTASASSQGHEDLRVGDHTCAARQRQCWRWFSLASPKGFSCRQRCDRVPGRDSRAAHLLFFVTWGRIQQLVCRLCICTSTTTTIRLSEPSPSCTQLFCRAVSRLLPGRDIVLGRQCHGKTIAVVVVVVALASHKHLTHTPTHPPQFGSRSSQG